MSESSTERSGVEAMAFEVVLSKLSALEQKLSGVEQAVQQTVPLLGKIVAQLEALNKKPDVPVATYAQLYSELQEEAPEPPAPVVDVVPSVPAVSPGRLRRWFYCIGAPDGTP
jgi:hypothetical protein